MSKNILTASTLASKASVAAALTAAEVRAAPAATKSIVIDKIVFSNEGAVNSFVLKDGDANFVFPTEGAIYLGTNTTFIYTPKTPIRLTAAKNLNITTTAADHSCTIVESHIE